MTNKEKRTLDELIECIKGDARLAGESWSSLTYWPRGVGVALRRFKYYCEQFRMTGETVDFHLYIDLRDKLVVFNALLKELPLLKERLRKRYGTLQMDFRDEPARDASTGEMKDSMAMAHFYIPRQEKEMLCDVFHEVYAVAQRLDKGKEVKPRGAHTKDILEEDGVGGAAITGDDAHRLAPKFTMRPIPHETEFSEDAASSCTIDGVISWVTTVDDLFDRKVISLADGRKMLPGHYVIPPYQRKYAWVYENVSQLCRDLLKAVNDGKTTYHLGTIILHHQSTTDTFYVVDGQQRLTTISQMLREEIFQHDGLPSNLSTAGMTAIETALDEYADEQNSILDMLRRCTLVVIAVNDINEAFQLFSTQNGRGRPLTPANLLKAYHLHELESDADASSIDKNWETNNVEKVKDGRLLSQVLGEHLYRLRCWSRGIFPTEEFSNLDIAEFKGITLWNGKTPNVPSQNLMRLRANAQPIEGYSRRSTSDTMDPLVTIDQPIANGANFFTYVSSYAEAYRALFGAETPAELLPFRTFYRDNCLRYEKSGRRGDTYARHIFESLCLFCYDRFAAAGLVACQKCLYQCAYFERAVKSRCYYSTCGLSYAMSAVRVMMSCMTLSDLKDRLHSLTGKVRTQYAKEAAAMRARGLPPGIEVVRAAFEK